MQWAGHQRKSASRLSRGKSLWFHRLSYAPPPFLCIPADRFSLAREATTLSWVLFHDRIIAFFSTFDNMGFSGRKHASETVLMSQQCHGAEKKPGNPHKHWVSRLSPLSLKNRISVFLTNLVSVRPLSHRLPSRYFATIFRYKISHQDSEITTHRECSKSIDFTRLLPLFTGILIQKRPQGISSSRSDFSKIYSVTCVALPSGRG